MSPSEFKGAEETTSFVARELLTLGDDREQTLFLTVPVPKAPLSAFLRAQPKHMSLLWDPPNGPSFAAGGVAHKITLKGRDRFVQLRSEVDAIWKRVRAVSLPGCPPGMPRIIGGFAFDAEQESPLFTEDFGAGAFSLPRWTLQTEKGQATLSLAIRGDEDDGPFSRDKVLAELQDILETLESLEGDTTELKSFTSRIPNDCVDQLPYPEWEDLISRIHGAIKGGAFEKLVAARIAKVRLPAIRDDLEVVSRLRAETGCTRFCFRRDHATFLGATPECLFTKKGDSLETQALAGTTMSTGSMFPEQSMQSRRLLASQKDALEHAHVVREITHALETLGAEVDAPATPTLQKIRDIIHLSTPITANLSKAIAAPELLSALHPTPAVGGVPTKDAAKWIVANEAQPRGWYTGAVGWLAHNGDSVFMVAIRCALLRSTEAAVFTGAGIVADSDPGAEYRETQLKQRPMLRALDVDTESAP